MAPLHGFLTNQLRMVDIGETTAGKARLRFVFTDAGCLWSVRLLGGFGRPVTSLGKE